MKGRSQIVFLLYVFVIGCSSRGPAKQEILLEVGRIPLMDAVPDSLLANVSDYLLAPSGVLYLADSNLHHLILLDEDLNLKRIVGRAGQGPGEFQWPNRLALVGDTLMVWDRLNSRLKYFTSDGGFLNMVRPNPGFSSIFSIGMSDDGRLLVPTYGIGVEYLFRIYNRQLSGISPLGTLEAPSTSVLLMGLRRSDARSRKIPDELKNQAFAIPTSDKGILLIHTAIPVFKKYDSSGGELWRLEQDHPQLRAIREDAYDSTLRETTARVYTISYWRGGASDGEGGCYLQLRGTDRITLFHLNTDGTLGEPIEGPEGNWGVLRRYNGLFWFLNRDTLELMQLQVGHGES